MCEAGNDLVAGMCAVHVDDTFCIHPPYMLRVYDAKVLVACCGCVSVVFLRWQPRTLKIHVGVRSVHTHACTHVVFLIRLSKPALRSNVVVVSHHLLRLSQITT